MDNRSSRPAKLHKRSSSSPEDPNKLLPHPPPSPHRRRLTKRSSGGSQQFQPQHNHREQKMDPGPLAIPPAPTSSGLSADKELLQRWSAREIQHGSPSHRPPSFSKRHASLDSPREIPLPSPSLSLSSPGYLSPNTNPLYSTISSGATLSTNSFSHSQAISPSFRIPEPTGYFPPLLSQTKADSSSSSGSSSKLPSRISFPPNRSFASGRYPVFENEESQGHDYGREHSADLSDWTNSTSPSPPPVMRDSTQAQKQHPDQLSVSSDLKHRSSLPSETTDANSALAPSSRPVNTLEGSHTYATARGTPGMRASATATPIFPHARPYSLPDGHSHSSLFNSVNTTDRTSREASSDLSDSAEPDPGTSMDTNTATASNSWPDRSSSASLPLPSQIPFHILSTVERTMSDAPGFAGSPAATEASGYKSDLGETKDTGLARTEHRLQHTQHPNSPYQHDHSKTSIPSFPGSTGLYSAESSEKGDERSPPPSASDLLAEPVCNDSSASAGTSTGQQATFQRQLPPQPQSQPEPPSQTHPQRPPQQRPISPFRAPQPRADPPSQSSGPASYMALASYPAPEPPVILGPTNDTPHRAYEPFLSHAPPPADSWIEVETTSSEYTLNVRLPGFRRDGITLATKRRRILHVVADSWENGGGHFERRISFGYDADLVQVRAEFDGEMLKISIPRRVPPVNFFQSTRPAPIGRSR